MNFSFISTDNSKIVILFIPMLHYGVTIWEQRILATS